MTIIFLVVVMFAVLQKFAKKIAMKIGNYIFSPDDAELDLRANIRDLKEQQSRISMVDEFARYMKLQRQIDKMLPQVKESASSRRNKFTLVNSGVKIGIHSLHGFVMLIVVMLHRNQPLMMVPVHWFFPMQRFVGLPSGVPGGVGVICWIVLCNAVVRRVKRLLAI